MADIRSSEPQATRGFVRILGAFFILGGGIMAFGGNGWYVNGLVPMRWVGMAVVALGAFLEIDPERFRQRASRFYEIADQLSNKS